MNKEKVSLKFSLKKIPRSHLYQGSVLKRVAFAEAVIRNLQRIKSFHSSRKEAVEIKSLLNATLHTKHVFFNDPWDLY